MNTDVSHPTAHSPPANARIAIVGGGLSGLVAALLLQQQGVNDVVLLEARPVLGGRILSIDAAGLPVDPAAPAMDHGGPHHQPGQLGHPDHPDHFDLGPSWFWPDLQPQLSQLVDALGLRRFAQFDDGDLLIERLAHAPPLRLRGPASEPSAMRLAGGTSALVTALVTALRQGRAAVRIHTGVKVQRAQRVQRLQRQGAEVALQCAWADGTTTTLRVEHVLLALPPRLAERSIAFEPPLPAALAQRWRATPTWMAPHAKYVAVYDTPFWRAQGLSGAARSGHGPMGEIHDVSMPGGRAALFGFLGTSPQARREASNAVLRAHCRAQLVRLFGAQAATPTTDALKDWAADPLTATDDDQYASGHHAEAPPPTADSGPWQGHLTGIASEWSPQFAGYLAGAVDAAARGLGHGLGHSLGDGASGDARRDPGGVGRSPRSEADARLAGQYPIWTIWDFWPILAAIQGLDLGAANARCHARPTRTRNRAGAPAAQGGF